MKKYKKWVESAHPYSQSIDGPALSPTTIHGAENQIRVMALNIRTTFGLDKRFNKAAIYKACELLEQAASLLDDGTLTGDTRNSPHEFTK